MNKPTDDHDQPAGGDAEQRDAKSSEERNKNFKAKKVVGRTGRGGG